MPEPAVTSADPTAAHVVQQWKYEHSPLIACRFDPTGRYLFVGSQDFRVLRLNLQTGQFTPLEGHDSWVRAIGFTDAWPPLLDRRLRWSSDRMGRGGGTASRR